MKKINLSLSILFTIFIIGISSVASAEKGLASAITDLKYPISELGNCSNPGRCQVFCDNPSNMEVCLDFAEKNDLLEDTDIELGRKVAKRVAEGNTPGGCKTRGECESFCQGKVENIDQCVNFAEELGVLNAEELKEVKQVAKALRDGATMPGNCKDKKECENYCKEDKNFGECVGFAEKAGFVSKEEAELARKVGGKGPGNCRGKEECERYCSKEENKEDCFDFAFKKGLISEESLFKMKEGVEKLKESLDNIPNEARSAVERCLKEEMGENGYKRFTEQGLITNEDTASGIGQCFSESMKNYAETIKNKYMEGGDTPNEIPEGRGPSEEEIENLQREMMQRGSPPTQEEIEEIQRDMMQRYAPSR